MNQFEAELLAMMLAICGTTALMSIAIYLWERRP